jgi:hypothetical protein
MEYLVDVHGHHTVAEALRYGLAQGPTLSPTLFNISMDEILRALDNGERGIDLGGIRVIGSAWSDDLTLIVTEDNLQATLDKLEMELGKYEKEAKMSKVCIVPLNIKHNRRQSTP